MTFSRTQNQDLRKIAQTALHLLAVRSYCLRRRALSGQFCVSPKNMNHAPLRKRRRIAVLGGLFAAFVSVSSPSSAAGAQTDETLWDKLRQGGYVLLMRHAATEAGIGDPPNFNLGDCSTQRNLSAAGRAQAVRAGNTFRAHRISFAEVRSSSWCRCADTATLAFGRTAPWSALNSFFDDPSAKENQSAAVLATVQSIKPPDNWMLVTHQVNITALTGAVPAAGEVVVIKPSQRLGQKPVVVGKLTLE